MTNAEYPPDDSSIVLACSSFDSGPATVTKSVAEPSMDDSSFGCLGALKPRGKRRWKFVPAILIDRSALFRAGLRHILSGSRFRVTADCGSFSDLPLGALCGRHGVVLVGLDRDTETDLSCIRSLLEQHREPRVIVFSDRMDAQQMIAAIDAGADGYLLRDEVKVDAILTLLEMVMAGGIVVPRGFTKLVCVTTRQPIVIPAQVNGPLPTSEECPTDTAGADADPDLATLEMEAGASGDLARLSERERLILTRLTLGAANKQIARELNIAEATVKAHVKSLLRKLRVDNRTQAAMWAINNVPPDRRTG